MRTPRRMALWLPFIMAVPACRDDRPPSAREVAAIDVVATHTPIHPRAGESVKLTASAAGRRIRLAYERFALEALPDGALKQTSVEGLKEVAVCEAEGGLRECSHTVTAGYPDASLIRFEAAVEGADGATGKEVYFFAAGAYPLADAAVPVRLKAGFAEGLDLVFIGTSDLNGDALRTALGDVVYGIYFERDPLKSGRGVYNFHYSTQVGDYQNGCNFTDPRNMDVLEATGDAVVFLHQDERRDCKYGKRISSEVANKKSMIHEAGHILFDLQDEYCCDSSYQAQICVPNLWDSLAGCERASSGLGYPKSACAQLEQSTGNRKKTLNFWRIDPSTGDPCIMGPGQHESVSWFRTACERRIQWRHAKCRSGQCFTSPSCP